MKMRIALPSLLTLLCLALVAVPATAQVVYSNGPDDGTGFFRFDGGNTTSNSFTLSPPKTGSTFPVLPTWAVYIPIWYYDDIGYADILRASLSLEPLGGETTFFSVTSHINLTSCSALNPQGYHVCNVNFLLGRVSLSPDVTYWLNLSDANNMEAGWGISNGPSQAAFRDSQGNTMFNIPSESFTLAAVPEPSSILLLGSGVLGLAGVLRRKLMP